MEGTRAKYGAKIKTSWYFVFVVIVGDTLFVATGISFANHHTLVRQNDTSIPSRTRSA